MIFPTNLEEVAALIEDGKPTVFLFVTTWCGDCHYIKPHVPAIEEAFPDLRFVQLDRDDFMPLAQEWAILGIPSLVVLENGQEIGRFVDKNRKTKEEIMNFLSGWVDKLAEKLCHFPKERKEHEEITRKNPSSTCGAGVEFESCSLGAG